MMTRSIAALLCLGLLVACGEDGGGNPLISNDAADDGSTTDSGDTGDDTGDTPGTTDPINSTATLPPGTEDPSPTTPIYRTEPFDVENGNGFANGYRYDADNDTFFVDGLAFDDTQPNGVPYSRSAPFGTMGPFALYEAPAIVTDPVSGNPITQFEHRALYGVSETGQTEFAIVRTGAYEEYGFGGFVYQRNATAGNPSGGVVLPDDGQAIYTGEYGGIRDFDGGPGLEYVRGDVEVAIDFRGFRNNCIGTVCADAVRGSVTNRRIFTTDGVDVTNRYTSDFRTSELPVLRFRIGPGVMTEDGEMTGTVGSSYIDVDGNEQAFETGNYYAVMSGDHTTAPGGEIVGIIVTTAEDLSGLDRGPVRETGGFLVAR